MKTKLGVFGQPDKEPKKTLDFFLHRDGTNIVLNSIDQDGCKRSLMVFYSDGFVSRFATGARENFGVEVDHLGRLKIQ